MMIAEPTMDALFFFSDVKWRTIKQRPQHLANGLSGRYDVYYCHPETKPPISLAVCPIDLGIIDVPMLAVPTNIRKKGFGWLGPVFRALGEIPLVVNLLAAWNVRRLRKLMAGYATVHIVAEGVLLGETARRFARHVNGAVIADILDHQSVSGATPLVKRQHAQMISEADVATITHSALAPVANRYSEIIHNGVDSALFKGSKIKPVGPPRKAIYVGHMAYVDWDFLNKVVFCVLLHDTISMSTTPSAILTFVGPPTDELLDLQRRFPKYVVVAGERSQYQCARMICASHVGIIPFKRMPETSTVDPCKYYEYVAGGCPVVATDFQSNEYGFMADTNNPSHFAELLRYAPTDFNDPLADRLTNEADWRNRTKQMVQLIEKISKIKEHKRLTEEA